jgi:AraC-like DNA-binding protein
MSKKVMTSYAASQVLMQIILEHGMPPEAFERRIGVRPIQITDPDERIPMRAVLKLFEIAIDLTGDPALALKLRKKTGLRYVHFVVSLAQFSSSLLEAAFLISRYARLISDADRFDIFDTGDRIKIVYTNNFPEYQNKWIPEHHFSLMADTTRSLVGRKMNPIEVKFRHPTPEYTGTYNDIFRAPISFHQPEDLIVFKKHDFLRPLNSHDPNVEAALKNYAELSLQKITRRGSLEEKVCQHIMNCLPYGGVNIKKVAKILNMDSSTLYRQLKVEGTTFKRLLLKTRQELAKNYLLQGMTSAQITYLIGFSEPAAFQRAFKRWYAINPGEYRKSLSV